MGELGRSDRKYSGDRQNTAVVYCIAGEGKWYAKVGPDKEGRAIGVTEESPEKALEALLAAIKRGEYRFDPELAPK